MTTLDTFVAVMIISAFLFFITNRIKTKNKQSQNKIMTPAQINNELEILIAQAKGKFFGITFTTKDGKKQIVNGKDKYRRLLAGGNDNVRHAGYVPFVNRNKETWVCAHKDQVVTFSCGKIQKQMRVSA